MSTRSFGITHRVALGAALVVLSATGLSAGPTPHMATRFGLIGIVPGQTLRLNVVNVSDDASCPSDLSVVLSFAHLDGSAVRDPDGHAIEARSPRLREGQAYFVDLTAAIGGAFRSRTQVRPVVSAMISEGGRVIEDGTQRCGVVATAEVFDNETGRTQFLLPGETLYFKEVDPAPGKPSSR